MAKKRAVVGIDIGTTKVVVLVGEVSGDGLVSVTGLGECPALGMRKGAIVDLEGIVKAIARAVEKAEQMSGCYLESAYVGVTGTHINSQSSRGVIAVAREDKEISLEDAQRVLQAARVITIPADRRIIHVLPTQYIVDGYDGVIDPVGMSGSRLEVEAQIVSGAATSLQNYLKSLQRANIKVEELVLNSLAAGEAVLLNAERELGCVLVDIGGGTTEIALFERGNLRSTAVLPIGGEHITSDLAVGLRTPMETAEWVKREHGCVLGALMPATEDIEICDVSGQHNRQISRKTVAAIVEPRVREILGMIREQLHRFQYKQVLPGGVIFTGGSSRLEGLILLAAEELELPARLGLPIEKVGGLADFARKPDYATAVGLLLYGCRQQLAWGAAAPKTSWGGLIDRLRHLWRNFFDPY